MNLAFSPCTNLPQKSSAASAAWPLIAPNASLAVRSASLASVVSLVAAVRQAWAAACIAVSSACGHCTPTCPAISARSAGRVIPMTG
ncbi:hypothetical protein [Kutzneria sp. 744]|uniref:hypothetical protein n=1 Tax=Kutzneria sp. (strain 744) TaxID=345341 RepID=UPI0005BE7BEA|nr:hypothetical protein [Kutzneria sp. 744]